jgi:hypothetical protein
MNYKLLYEKQKELLEIYHNWATVKSKSDMQVIGRLESELAALKAEEDGYVKATKDFMESTNKC